MLKLHHLLVLNAKHQQPFQRVKGTFDQWLGSQVQWCSGCVAVHQSRDFTYGLCSKRIYLRHISLPKKTKNIKVSYEQDVFFWGGPSVFEMIIAEIFVDTRGTRIRGSFACWVVLVPRIVKKNTCLRSTCINWAWDLFKVYFLQILPLVNHHS